jgi:cation:H+ antiporter
MFRDIIYALDTRTGLAYDRAQNPARHAPLNAYGDRIALQARTQIDIDEECAAVLKELRIMLLYIALCLIGFLLLYFGAEWLVKGSSSLARSLGVTPIVIGLTVVAFGTSAPELVVSLISSIKGKSMIAVGNVVGSNICNIALVLGLSALLNPIKSDPSVIRRDIPIMLAISLYLLVLSVNNTLGRIEGATLFGGIIAYTFFNYYQAKKENREAGGGEMTAAIETELEDIGFIASRPKQILLVIVGIAGVVGGAQMVVESAVYIMTQLGVSEKFIGLTIVAFGTSLPELATSVVAAMRGEMDISIGNLVGSNVFNIMSVLGAASLVRPIPIPGGFVESGLWIDYLVMLFTSFLPWLLMRRTYTVDRKGGAILLSCYVGYLVYLIVKA